MFKSIDTKAIAILAFSALFLVACDQDEDKAATAPALSVDSAILQYVPADTPYLFASLSPLPDDVMDQLEPKIDRVLVSYQTIIREVVAAKQAEMPEEQRGGEEAQQLNAFVEELSTLVSIDGLRGAGIERDSMAAFYGNGLLPVLRVELSDGALFESTIARLEERAGNQMPVAEIDGQPYRYFDAEEVRIVIAVVGNQAVFTVVPAEFDDAQTGRALGLTLPDSSIAETGVLQELMQSYEFTDNFVGFIDVAAIVERFVGEPSGLDADLMALLDEDQSTLSEVCRAEIRDVASVAPRMVMGYTAIAANRFDSNIIFELRADIAEGLQALPTSVPGLGGDRGGLMSFGMSLDVMAARSFMEARLDAMEADPYECEHLADLQASVAGGRETLSQPVPPMVYDFKGFLAVIDELEGLNVATQTPPTSVDGSIVLAMDNAQALVSMGAMFSPELAALNLQADGNPVALDMPQLQAMGMAAFVAMNDNALAISVGEDAETQVQDILSADSANPPPFLSFSMDAARYYSFMGDAIAAGDSGDESAPTAELKTAMTEMMQAISDLYDRMSGDVLFTENGIELHMTETLKD